MMQVTNVGDYPQNTTQLINAPAQQGSHSQPMLREPLIVCM